MKIGFVNLSVASGETCNGSNNFVKKMESFPQGSRTRPCCKEFLCLQEMSSLQPANDIQDPVCDFPCCSETKCIRAICGIHLGQPQPRLLLRASQLFLVVGLVSLATSFLWVFFYFCDGLFTVKEAKQATLQLPRSFSTVARFELEPQIRETQSYQTTSSGNMPRRNLHCKYYVRKHITIQALEATQSHNAPSLTMLTLYHCKLQLHPFHFEVW